MTKAEQNATKLYQLRRKTVQAECELKTVRLLAAQSKRLEQVTLEKRQILEDISEDCSPD
jgi:hypothetical protein